MTAAAMPMTEVTTVRHSSSSWRRLIMVPMWNTSMGVAQLEAAVRPAWSMMSAGTILNRNSSKKLINTTKMDESFALVQMPSQSPMTNKPSTMEK